MNTSMMKQRKRKRNLKEGGEKEEKRINNLYLKKKK